MRGSAASQRRIARVVDELVLERVLFDHVLEPGDERREGLVVERPRLAASPIHRVLRADQGDCGRVEARLVEVPRGELGPGGGLGRRPALAREERPHHRRLDRRLAHRDRHRDHRGRRLARRRRNRRRSLRRCRRSPARASATTSACGARRGRCSRGARARSRARRHRARRSPSRAARRSRAPERTPPACRDPDRVYWSTFGVEHVMEAVPGDRAHDFPAVAEVDCRDRRGPLGAPVEDEAIAEDRVDGSVRVERGPEEAAVRAAQLLVEPTEEAEAQDRRPEARATAFAASRSVNQ